MSHAKICGRPDVAYGPPLIYPKHFIFQLRNQGEGVTAFRTHSEAHERPGMVTRPPGSQSLAPSSARNQSKPETTQNMEGPNTVPTLSLSLKRWGLQFNHFQAQCPNQTREAFTFISLLFVGDFLQVNEMGCQRYIVHAAFIPHLDFHPPTQGRKHFLEDHLFMPHGIGTILLHCGSPLKTKPGGWEPWGGKKT